VRSTEYERELQEEEEAAAAAAATTAAAAAASAAAAAASGVADGADHKHTASDGEKPPVSVLDEKDGGGGGGGAGGGGVGQLHYDVHAPPRAMLARAAGDGAFHYLWTLPQPLRLLRMIAPDARESYDPERCEKGNAHAHAPAH
jgi:hypothetical protein